MTPLVIELCGIYGDMTQSSGTPPTGNGSCPQVTFLHHHNQHWLNDFQQECGGISGMHEGRQMTDTGFGIANADPVCPVQSPLTASGTALVVC